MTAQEIFQRAQAEMWVEGVLLTFQEQVAGARKMDKKAQVPHELLDTVKDIIKVMPDGKKRSEIQKDLNYPIHTL